jgi:transposase
MSLHPEEIGPVPEETARVARAAFPRGNRYIQMRDVLGAIYDDARFAPLFARRGRPAAAPWRLALVTVMQFAEGLSDRQAAEAVRARLDWKYALGLELADPGFDFSVLSEFRARLVAGAAAHLLLDEFLAACTARGLLAARGRQRTDSTHVLAAVRALDRLERVTETLRAALNAVAEAAPDWLRERTPPAWFERYGRRAEDARLPRGREARLAFAATVGEDGRQLLAEVVGPAAPPDLRRLPALETLRRTWVQQYVVVEGRTRWREPAEMPTATEQIESPFDPEARYGAKRGMSWVGYKAHLTESCDDDRPYLLTHVHTTLAPAADVEQLAAIQQGLADAGLLPARHLADAAYIRAGNLVASRDEHGVDLVGPMYEDHQWQARAGTGYDVTHFAIDWDAKSALCPQGRRSARWCETATARGPMIRVEFAREDCLACPARADCTRAKGQPRGLTLQVRAEHEAIQAARRRQETEAYAAEYRRRAGVEGTLSQGVRAFGLRRTRYRGLAKTHLGHVATAVGINVQRVAAWLSGTKRACTRQSHFATLAPAG